MDGQERQPEVVFFYSDARNVRVGQKLLIQGRGRGVVRFIVKPGPTSYIERVWVDMQDEEARIEDVLYVGMEFQDEVVGTRLLPPEGTSKVLQTGWGTFKPTLQFRSEDGYRITRSAPQPLTPRAGWP